MGSVKAELKNDGRGVHHWDYLPLSDPHVVKACIENRSRVDKGYRCNEPWAREWNLPGGVTDSMPDPVALTYLSLDDLIEKSNLSQNQRQTIILMMMGYGVPDIANNLFHKDKAIVYRYYKAAVKVICKQAVEDWKKVYSKRVSLFQ